MSVREMLKLLYAGRLAVEPGGCRLLVVDPNNLPIGPDGKPFPTVLDKVVHVAQTLVRSPKPSASQKGMRMLEVIAKGTGPDLESLLDRQRILNLDKTEQSPRRSPRRRT